MIEHNIFTIIFSVFVLLSVRDVFIGQATIQQHGQASQAAVGEPKPAISDYNSLDQLGVTDQLGMPVIKIQYCQSCGYRQAFEDIKSRLKIDVPMCVVEGEVHRPDFLRSQLANFIFLAKTAFFIMIYFRFDPFAHYNLQTPRFWNMIMENRMAASVMVMLFASSIETNMMNTGAFEIFYNNTPIWSKIEKGRMPYYAELLNGIKSQLLGNKNKYILT